MSNADRDLSGPPMWFREIFPGGPRLGFYENLERHAVLFVDRGGDTLIVSFDNLAEAGGRHVAREPWAGKFVADNGWSHLGVFAHGPTWFRDAELIARLEKLRSDGFFDRFDRVVLCGTSMGGFGALTFARLSPGATVIAFSPQSTLSAELVPWEPRFRKGQAQDWSLPYSDAAEGLDDARCAYVVYDPFVILDRKHAKRLTSDKVVPLHAPGCGHKSALLLRRMDRLKQVMQCAVDGQLTPLTFAQNIRDRKNVYLYKQIMQQHLIDRSREKRAESFGQAFKLRRRRASAAT